MPKMWRKPATKVLELIPKGASVGVGGSETLKAMDMINILRNGDYHFFDRYQEGLPFSEVEEIYRQALLADVFLTSSNAITRRASWSTSIRPATVSQRSAMDRARSSWSPGVNKDVDTLDDAMKRLRSDPRPLNAMRVHHKAPCVETGKCMVARSSSRSAIRSASSTMAGRRRDVSRSS